MLVTPKPHELCPFNVTYVIGCHRLCILPRIKARLRFDMLVAHRTVGGIAHICFNQWFQITADAHPRVSGVSKDQKFCEKFKNTHCQVDHPAKIE